MRYDPARQNRHSIRLKGYDYTVTGAYFVTICTRHRECVLDDPIVAGIITDVWIALPLWFPTIALDEIVVMPNHVHLNVWLKSAGQNVGATLAVAPDTANIVGATRLAVPVPITPHGAGASPARDNLENIRHLPPPNGIHDYLDDIPK